MYRRKRARRVVGVLPIQSSLDSLGDLKALCPEIRNKIYDYVFSPQVTCWGEIVHDAHRLSAQCGDWDLWRCPMPAALAINNHIYREAVHAFWSGAYFELTIDDLDPHSIFHLREATDHYIKESHGHIQNISLRIESLHMIQPTLKNLIDLTQFYSQYAPRLTGKIEPKYLWEETRGPTTIKFYNDLARTGMQLYAENSKLNSKHAAEVMVEFFWTTPGLVPPAPEDHQGIWSEQGRRSITDLIGIKWQYGLDYFYTNDSFRRYVEYNHLQTCHQEHEKRVAVLREVGQ